MGDFGISNESIRGAVAALRDETIERLSQAVNIGSLLDTPEELAMQVADVVRK